MSSGSSPSHQTHLQMNVVLAFVVLLAAVVLLLAGGAVLLLLAVVVLLEHSSSQTSGNMMSARTHDDSAAGLRFLSWTLHPLTFSDLCFYGLAHRVRSLSFYFKEYFSLCHRHEWLPSFILLSENCPNSYFIQRLDPPTPTPTLGTPDPRCSRYFIVSH